MNKNNQIILWITVLTLWGCGEAPTMTPEEIDVHDTPLVIGSVLINPTEKVQTRENTFTSLDTDGNTIGVLCYLPANGYNSKKLCKYVYTSGKWTPADASQTVYLGNLSTELYVVYPWDDSNINPEKIELKAHQVNTSKEAAASYACARGVAIMKGYQTSANVGYQYAKAQIRIKGASNMAGAKISDFTLQNICHTSTHNLLTGAYSEIDTSTPIHIRKEQTLTSEEADYAILLIPPRSTGGTPAYRLTVNGKTLSGTLTKAFQKGMETTIVLVIHNKGAEVETVTTEYWSDESIDLDGHL